MQFENGHSMKIYLRWWKSVQLPEASVRVSSSPEVCNSDVIFILSSCLWGNMTPTTRQKKEHWERVSQGNCHYDSDQCDQYRDQLTWGISAKHVRSSAALTRITLDTGCGLNFVSNQRYLLCLPDRVSHDSVCDQSGLWHDGWCFSHTLSQLELRLSLTSATADRASSIEQVSVHSQI